MRTLRLIAAILAMATLLAVPVAYGDTDMTSQRNTFARQAEVRQNLDRLINPGVQANLVGRTNQNVGTVKANTRRISATSFVADVEIQTRFNGATVIVPGVRFNVPISEGDVVSLEIVGGHPLNGVFGTPIRPKGPNILIFNGPTNATEWAADESAPSGQRTTNATFESYVLPINTGGAARVNTPTPDSLLALATFSLPDTLTILTIPAAAHVEFSAQLHGGLRIVGGPRAGSYPIRNLAGQLMLTALYFDPSTVSSIVDRADTHNGIVGARGTGPDIGNYRDRINNPLVHTGGNILFARIINLHPDTVGGDFRISVSCLPVNYTQIEYYRQVTHPEHPMSTGHPEHPEYSFWTWDALEAPAANETYYLWMGISDVQLTIVELGTGGSR